MKVLLRLRYTVTLYYNNLKFTQHFNMCCSVPFISLAFLRSNFDLTSLKLLLPASAKFLNALILLQLPDTMLLLSLSRIFSSFSATLLSNCWTSLSASLSASSLGTSSYSFLSAFCERNGFLCSMGQCVYLYDHMFMKLLINSKNNASFAYDFIEIIYNERDILNIDL